MSSSLAFKALLLLALLGFDLRAEIQTRYDQWTKAYMASDLETLDSMLAPGYVLVMTDKSESSRSEYLAYLKIRKKMGQDTSKYSAKVRKARLVDGQAQVESVETQETRKDGKRVLHRHEYRDTWVKLDGAWKLLRTETVKESTEIKGNE